LPFKFNLQRYTAAAAAAAAVAAAAGTKIKPSPSKAKESNKPPAAADAHTPGGGFGGTSGVTYSVQDGISGEVRVGVVCNEIKVRATQVRDADP
jgi:hypothetical protein